MTTQIPNNSIFNRNAFLRTQISFPQESQDLVEELDKSWVDLANAVNNRIISLFGTDKNVVTGENWFIKSNTRQQTLRRVYTFTTPILPGAEMDIPILITNFTSFTRIYGTVNTANSDYRPIPYVDPATLTTSIALLVGPIAGINKIRIVNGATSPQLNSGIIVLEWLSQP